MHRNVKCMADGVFSKQVYELSWICKVTREPFVYVYTWLFVHFNRRCASMVMWKRLVVNGYWSLHQQWTILVAEPLSTRKQNHRDTHTHKNKVIDAIQRYIKGEFSYRANRSFWWSISFQHITMLLHLKIMWISIY